MKPSEVVYFILKEKKLFTPQSDCIARAYAPSNIALCKYWGKRDQQLNLPVTSSLSVSLGDRGSYVALSISAASHDTIILNGNPVEPVSAFAKRFAIFMDLFRHSPAPFYFHAEIISTIPVGAGLASSACGFASLVLALDQLFNWQLTPRELSILARLGSGSASRSLWSGFVEWQCGERVDGMDSHGIPLDVIWPDLCIGLLIFTDKEKPISSRVAMQCTLETSPLYHDWPQHVAHDLALIKQAIIQKDFNLLAATAEANAVAMHATMQSAVPAIDYCLPATRAAMEKVWQLRKDGIAVYFTQDAGSNLKLLFLRHDLALVRQNFKHVEVVTPFLSSGEAIDDEHKVK